MGDEFIEFYHVEGHSAVHPICNTLQASQEISDAVNALYESVAFASTHVRIARETKNMMSSYLKSKADQD